MERSTPTRRDVLKLSSAAVVGGVGTATIPASADTCCDTSYPKYASQDFSVPEPTATADTIDSSASTKFNFLDSVYAAGEWRFFLRTQTEVGSAYIDGQDSAKKSISSDHSISVENTQGKRTDSRHGAQDRHFGVSGVSGSLPSWSNTAYTVAGALIGYWNPYVGAVFTAGSIINSLSSPDKDGVKSDGIFYDWTAAGAEGINHLLKWESAYPPEQGVEHAVQLTERVERIPDGTYSGETSPYEVSWDVYLGSMMEPTEMSSSEVDRFGIEKVRVSSLPDMVANSISKSTGTVYRARNPEVKVELTDSSTANTQPPVQTN